MLGSKLPVGTDSLVKSVKAVPERISPVTTWRKQAPTEEKKVSQSKINLHFFSPVKTRKHLVLIVLVKLIGVNKGRHVTLKCFSLLINVNRKHRLYICTNLVPIIVCIINRQSSEKLGEKMSSLVFELRSHDCHLPSD